MSDQREVHELIDSVVKEAAELIHRVINTKRFGLGEDFRCTNLDLAQQEWNQLIAAVEMLQARGVNLFRDDTLVEMKKAHLTEYLKRKAREVRYEV